MSTNRLAMMLPVITLCAVASRADEPPHMAGVALHTRPVEGLKVHYQPELEPAMDGLAAALTEGVAELHATADRIGRMRDQADAIVDDLNRIVRFNPLGAGPIDQHAALSAGLHRATLPGVGDEPAPVYLLLRETVRAYLRDGGELANFTHDPASDEVTQRAGPTAGEPFVIPVAEDDPTDVAAAYFEALNTALWAGPTLALRMTVGHTLQARVRVNHPHVRWFFDGYADALTFHLLREHLNEDAAALMFDGRDIASFAGLRDEANLLHWPIEPLALQLNTAAERRLEQARLTFAMHEALRLIDAHGPGHVGQVLDRLGEMGGSLPQQLLAALHEVTGEDVAERLRAYQSFNDEAEGIVLYRRRVRRAEAEGDAAAELHARLRQYELSSQLSQAGVMRMSELVREIDGDERAFEPFDQAIEALTRRGMGAEGLALREAAVVAALQYRQPARVQDHAEALLAADADHVPALFVKLMHAVPEGDVQTSEAVSRHLIEITEPNDPGHEFARAVLEQLESGSRPE